MTAYTILEPLIRRKVFADEQIAVRELTRDYVRLQVEMLMREIRGFERRYGMSLDRFDEYLHLRSSLLTGGQLGPEQKRTLGQALMREEDDWLDWKAAQEMLDNWLDLRQEVASARFSKSPDARGRGSRCLRQAGREPNSE